MKKIYYYIRNADHHPIITICLIRDTHNNVGKGIAFCSKKDKFVKKTGRLIAQRRALRALKKKESSLPIRDKINRIYPLTIITIFTMKSYYNSLFTNMDCKLLDKVK